MAKYVQINSVPHGSTGNVMFQTQQERIAMGDECWAIWGRGRNAQNDHEFNFGSKTSFLFDVCATRIDGKAGFHSKKATKRLLRKLDEINPDIVHLHNIHGYYVNVEMLFNWLQSHHCDVIWTLHDCWAFTGHCAYFTSVGCNQWRSKTGCTTSCPQIAAYPKTFSKSSIPWVFSKKKTLFSSIDENSVTIITPSNWLARLASATCLSRYLITVKYNDINRNTFKPSPSNLRQQYNLTNKFIILGVASPWDQRKGLDDFIRLSKELDSDIFSILLVGLNKKQLNSLPGGIIGFEKVANPSRLAEFYSAADVFFNPTKEDNYPTTILEAEACGTPVITYDVGGCVEAISAPYSCAVSNINEAIKTIEALEGLRRTNPTE